MIAIAKAVHRAMIEHNRRNPSKPVKIDSSLSRILMLDPDYSPKKNARGSRPPKQLSIFTVKAVADRLETTVGALLGEKAFAVQRAEVAELREIAAALYEKISNIEGSILPLPVTTPQESKTEGEDEAAPPPEGGRHK